MAKISKAKTGAVANEALSAAGLPPVKSVSAPAISPTNKITISKVKTAQAAQTTTPKLDTPKIGANAKATPKGGKSLADIAKDIGKGNLYTTEREAAGFVGGTEDTAKGYSALIYNALAKSLSGNRFMYNGKSVENTQNLPVMPNATAEKLQKASDNILESGNIADQYKQNIDERYNPTVSVQAAGNLTEQIGRMVPTIAATAAGGTGAGRLAIGLQSGMQSAKQAKAEGATNQQALSYGLYSGALETGIESIAGGIPGLPKGTVTSLIEKVTKSPIASKLIDILGEGGEEALSAVLTPYLQRAVYNPNAKNATASEIADAAFQGMLVSGLMQGAQTVATRAAGQTQQKPAPVTPNLQPKLATNLQPTAAPTKQGATLTEIAQNYIKPTTDMPAENVSENVTGDAKQADVENAPTATNSPDATDEESIRIGNGSISGLKIKYNPSLKSEARNQYSYIEVGDKFFALSKENQSEVLSHEVQHTIAEDFYNGDATLFEAIMNNPAFGSRKETQDGRVYWEGIFGDVGSNSVDETFTQSLAVYDRNPSWMKENHPDAYEFIKAYKEKQPDALPQGMGAASGGFDPYTQKVNEYGAIPAGEKPTRTVDVPKQTSENKIVSQTVRTVEEASATPDSIIEPIETATLKEIFSYERKTDKQAVENAEKVIQYKGYETALKDWTAEVRKGVVSKDLSALGFTLYNNAANSGNAKQAVEILTDIVNMQRSGAQATQAVRLLKKMSPQNQLYAVQRSVQNLQQELWDKYNEKAPNLLIPDDLLQKYTKATSDAERAQITKEIYREIGNQIPSTFTDKFNHWRYMAMLFNLRTHAKNVTSNFGFAGVRAVKNTVAKGLEAAFIGGKDGRTKAFLTMADRDLVKAAYDDYANVADEITAYGKYDEAQSEIDKGRRIFKNRILEGARKFNAVAMDTEDVWVSKPAYARALAGYMKANNIGTDAFKIGNNKALDEARAYAVQEARKASFRDANQLSNWVASLGKSQGKNKSFLRKGANVLVEGVLPFRRTPANILARGIEYSPIGLAKGLTYDLVQVARGEKSSAQAIDQIASGFTGTALLGLGVWLASMGLITGGGSEDDKQKSFDELQGIQDFSLQIGDTTYTLDWLSPATMPLFVGVEIYNRMTDKSETGITLKDGLESVARITNPVLETSMLQSLDKVLEGISYSDSPLYYLISQAAVNYIGQVIPTLAGQIARTIDDTRRTTFTDKQSGIPDDAQYFLQKTANKIPGLSMKSQPYVDLWGREEDQGNALQRTAENFISPGYVSKTKTSDMEKELQRLYDQTGESVLPTRADKYITDQGVRYDMTADEYLAFQKTKGQTAYDTLTELTASPQYKALDDAGKSSVVMDTYTYASQKAKDELLTARKIKHETPSLVTELEGAEKLNIAAAQYLGTKYQFRSRAETDTKTAGEVTAAEITKDLTSAAKAYLGKTKTVETAADVKRVALFERKDLTAAQKAYLDKTLVGEQKNPVNYQDAATFYLSTTSQAQQEKYPEIKRQLGISAKDYTVYLSYIAKPKDSESWTKEDKITALKKAGLSHTQAVQFYRIVSKQDKD